MKNLHILLVFFALTLGCKEPQTGESEKSETSSIIEDPLNPLGIDSAKLIEGEYLFFLNESKYSPLINDDDPNFNYQDVDFKKVDLLKEIIIADLDSAFGLKLKKNDVYATTFSGFYVFEMPTVQALEILSNTSIISSAQKNFTIQNVIARMQSPGPIPQNIIARMQEWQYDSVKRTSSKVLYVNPTMASINSSNKIWIVDSGVDANHSDLNVVMDPTISVSFVDNEPNPLVDIVGHGTHCAGIAAGKANLPTGIGMNGVSPGAPIVSVKVIDWNGIGIWKDIVDALDHIFINSLPGDVVSLSIGDLLPGNASCLSHPQIWRGIKKLADHGVFVVMAAGNTGVNSDRFFPGCFNHPNVFTIGSLDVTFGFDSNQQFSIPTFSTYSNDSIPSIDYVAPGDFVFSTFTCGGYAILSGTSMATAMVAGIIHAKGSNPNGTETLIGPPGSTTYPIAKY
ncbi:MAG TPA: S8 family serine peptidase [Algoriphagus sp.]|nr:S8 family serine peptidase [Algoriphagus sp.]